MRDTLPGEASHRTKGLLRLTMACNERCPFCNVPMEDYDRPTPSEAEVLAQLDAFEGQDTLTLSGGEPTLLRKRLLTIIRAGRNRKIRFVELQTNAILIDDAYARALADAGLTSAFVSLLSHVPTLHDTLAGLEGAYGRCLSGIDALHAAGISVTLNPVTARETQTLLAEYVDFVATRLPFVKSISVSAVQPHGRGAANLDLLPDYAILADTIRLARKRAEIHGISLLNPYCGLPACIGWEDALDRCVESFEASGGGWHETAGLENTGDKRHGPPCRHCVLRPRCGGAWHAYWDHRAGSGIRPPLTLTPPWEPQEGQSVLSLLGDTELPEAPPVSPTVWIWTDRIRESVGTEWLLEVADSELGSVNALTRALRSRPPSPRLHLLIRRTGSWRDLARAVAMGVVLRAETLYLPADTPEQLLEALRVEHGVRIFRGP